MRLRSRLLAGVLALAALAPLAAEAQTQVQLRNRTNTGFLGDVTNPLTITDPAFTGVEAMTVGVTYTARRSIGMACTVAGNVAVTFSDASILTVPVGVGWQQLPFAVTAVNTTGTTATCTYSNLK